MAHVSLARVLFLESKPSVILAVWNTDEGTDQWSRISPTCRLLAAQIRLLFRMDVQGNIPGISDPSKAAGWLVMASTCMPLIAKPEGLLCYTSVRTFHVQSSCCGNGTSDITPNSGNILLEQFFCWSTCQTGLSWDSSVSLAMFPALTMYQLHLDWSNNSCCSPKAGGNHSGTETPCWVWDPSLKAGRGSSPGTESSSMCWI